MVDYFVRSRKDGEVVGPYTASEIRSLAAEGRLDPQDMLSTDKARWVVAGQQRGLVFGGLATGTISKSTSRRALIIAGSLVAVLAAVCGYLLVSRGNGSRELTPGHVSPSPARAADRIEPRERTEQLVLAAGRGDIGAVRNLIAQGADVNGVDSEGWTALHSAVWDKPGEAHVEVVRFLLAKGADPNARDDIGWTPLHWAVSNNHEPLIRLLISSGADVNAKSDDESTPLGLAVGSDRHPPEIAELLRAHGARGGRPTGVRVSVTVVPAAAGSDQTGTIRGGAWIVRGNGQSDLLRGLTVYVCKDRVLRGDEGVEAGLDYLRKFFRDATEFAQKKAAEGTTHAAESRQSSMDVIRKSAGVFEEMAKSWSEIAGACAVARDRAEELYALPATGTVQLVDLHRLVVVHDRADGFSPAQDREWENVGNNSVWKIVLLESTVASTTTNIDGKYEIPSLATGDYVVYALQRTDLSAIDWCVAVSVKPSTSLTSLTRTQHALLTGPWGGRTSTKWCRLQAGS